MVMHGAIMDGIEFSLGQWFFCTERGDFHFEGFESIWIS